ncbi:MAG: FRG domain-containing protein [Clostridiales bacterium]|nr:FRG domain-containing protein [Clostridiales bacterium]
MDNIKCEINSVSDVIEVIESIKRLGKIFPRNSESKIRRYFRGQSNYKWTLIPSLYRDNTFIKEESLILESMNMFPEEFEGLDKFSILVKLQHYGMKTRLLDLTENPLVALYFACNENNGKNDKESKDGALYIFDNANSYFPHSNYVESMMEYIFDASSFVMSAYNVITYFEKIPYDFFYFENTIIEILNRIKIISSEICNSKNTIEDEINKSDEINNLIDKLFIPGTAVTPKRNNPRLIAQQGAFYLPDMQVEKWGSNKDKSYSFTPFPFFKLNKSNSGDDEYEEYNDIKIGYRNYKLKIPQESKRNILKELDYLQINESTLFDDLEHKLKYLQEKIEREI